MPSNEAFLDCIFVHFPHLCPGLGGSGVAREAFGLLYEVEFGGHPENCLEKHYNQLVMSIGQFL